MKVITSLSRIKKEVPQPVVALGAFDGIHRGHQKIIATLQARAKLIGGASVVLTFRPHPLKFFRGRKFALELTGPEHKVILLESLGVEILVLIKFDERFARMAAGDFVRKILVRKLGVREVIVGEGFRFGRGRAGDIDLLKKIAGESGFSVTPVKKLHLAGGLVSSTRIRSLIRQGKISPARRLLGRAPSLLGEVVRGESRGRLLGFPTANLKLEPEVLPPPGVYAVRARLKGRVFPGALNIGVQPTFRKQRRRPVIEVNIFGFKRDIYGQKIEVEFLKKIRPERRFLNREALVRQISRDVARTQAIFVSARPSSPK